VPIVIARDLVVRFVTVLALLGAGRAALAQGQPSHDFAGPPPPVLDVPYLPQTDLLCGGAAVAMVLRYWGDRRVLVEEFAPLVDRDAGGIAEDVLVEEVKRRGWQVVRIDGSLELLRESLKRGEPPILLIESRPGFLHYVVFVGLETDGVLLHDPTWGPARRLDTTEFQQRWKASGQWALVVRPGAALPAKSAVRNAAVATPSTACDRALDEALRTIEKTGLDPAEDLLTAVSLQCPAESRPLSELAGVRFARRDWAEAERLARRAVTLNSRDEYAWQILAGSRFLQDDPEAALTAWNEIGRPRVDLLEIDGLRQTRYALVAESAGIQPGRVLTVEDLKRAERRLRQLPTFQAVRLAYRPDADGYAVIDAQVLERSTRPEGLGAWLGLALAATVERELGVEVPGPTGQGELWSGGWRWWPQRERLRVSFAAPRLRGWPGVWRVSLSQEAQSFAVPRGLIREERLRGSVAVERWLTSSTWYRFELGVDVWDGRRRTASIGGRVERRFISDLLAIGAGGHASASGGERPFGVADVSLTVRTPAAAHLQHSATFGLDVATARTPLSAWGGADSGTTRGHLLRAHPLLTDGVVTGPAFGRVLRYASVESAYPIPRLPGRLLAVAGFADFVSVRHRLPDAPGLPWHVDAGIGLRVRLRGGEGALRLDYGRGLRDGADAISIGWQHR
jgi:hypothetical protein